MRQHVGNAMNEMVDAVAATAAVHAPKPVAQPEADEMTTPEAQPGAKPEDQSELDKGGLLDIQADATAEKQQKIVTKDQQVKPTKQLQVNQAFGLTSSRALPANSRGRGGKGGSGRDEGGKRQKT